MPPKGMSKKTEQKVKEKIIEDKTFGLKNKKKSKVVQKFVQQVTTQVKNMGAQQKAHVDRKAEAEKKAAAAAAEQQRELALLLKSAVVQPKLPPGVDPKTVICEYFKQGLCTKGKKCKFAHDLTIGSKGRLDLSRDLRDVRAEETAADEMADWDQEKLEAVVQQKHSGQTTKPTDIVCRYFLDAVEKEVYGWFWTCPNGGDACKYRHALPPGYVYKSKKQREAEAQAAADPENKVSIEEEIEELRLALPQTGLTPVTAETFAKWKADRSARKREEDAKKVEEEKKRTGGRGLHVLSGRALFSYDPSLFVDDEGAADDDLYVVREDGEDGEGGGDASESGPRVAWEVEDEGTGGGGGGGGGSGSDGEGDEDGDDGDDGEEEDGVDEDGKRVEGSEAIAYTGEEGDEAGKLVAAIDEKLFLDDVDEDELPDDDEDDVDE